MERHVAEFLAARAQAAGGFTYCTRTGTFPHEGFAVALSRTFERKLDVLTPEAIAEYFVDNERTCEGANAVYEPGSACLGVWCHEGTWYLDVSVVVPERGWALRLGAERGQLAVYDLANGESIPCSE